MGNQTRTRSLLGDDCAHNKGACKGPQFSLYEAGCTKPFVDMRLSKNNMHIYTVIRTNYTRLFEILIIYSLLHGVENWCPSFKRT
jgi:hypothetical protein